MIKKFDVPKDEIEILYSSGMSFRQIANLYDVNTETVSRYCRRVGIKARSAGEAVRFGHKTGNIVHRWKPPNKGYQYTRNDGYVCLTRPDDPNADTTGRLYEHRKVMAGVLGRPLTKEEIVHHLNGNPSDNRPENLMLVTRNNHDTFALRKAMQARIRELEKKIP